MGKLEKSCVYICTVKKLHLKKFKGRWFYLSDYTNIKEFLEDCTKLHSDEDKPQFVCFDYGNFPKPLIRNNWIPDNIFGLIRHSLSMNEETQEAFFIWLSRQHKNIWYKHEDDLVRAFQFVYKGRFETEEQFTRYYAEEDLAITQAIYPSFDFESFKTNLFNWQYTFIDGFVFTNMKP